MVDATTIACIHCPSEIKNLKIILLALHMNTKQLAYNTLKASCKATAWLVRQGIKATAVSGKFVYDHREQIFEGTKFAATSGIKAAESFGKSIYDTASLQVFSRDKIENLKTRLVEQGEEYRELTGRTFSNHRMVDSIVVGGDLLSDILNHGASADVKAAFAAAYPQESQHISFEEAVRALPDEHLNGLISGVKGKLFEMQYVDYLNGGNLPDGYEAVLATSATQPGWDIAIHGPDGHIANVLQMKATDSVSYIHHALERYPDIDVVTTDEVYSQLIMNGAADHVTASGIDNADITQLVSDAVDQSAIHMHWTPPIISLAMIAFTTYTLKDADNYEKAIHFGDRSGKSYLAYLIGGGVATITQTWWLGLLAGIGSRYLAGRGKNQRDQYHAISQIITTNERILGRLHSLNLQNLNA